MDSIFGAWLRASVGAGEPYSGSEDGIPYNYLIRGVRENVGQVGADQGGVPGLQMDGLPVDDHIHGATLQQDDFFAGVDDRQFSVYAAGRQLELCHQRLGHELPGGHGGHDPIAHVGVWLGKLDHLILVDGRSTPLLTPPGPAGWRPRTS